MTPSEAYYLAREADREASAAQERAAEAWDTYHALGWASRPDDPPLRHLRENMGVRRD